MALYIITIIALLFSLLASRKKTLMGLKKAFMKLKRIAPPLIIVLIAVSFTLFFLPGPTISRYLAGGNKFLGLGIASVLGSITVMPGFIAFPLSGILKENHVPYMVISAFTTTLMMVGVITFPIEQRYFGTRVALIRNILSFVTALIVALITGFIFGELF